MRKHNGLLSLLLAGSALLGLNSPLMAQQQVPFQGTFEGAFTVTPVQPPFIVDVLSAGRGKATQLGLYQLSFPHRVDRSTAPSTGVGTYTFVAANGDKLFADVLGQAKLVSPGVLYGVEKATITGGTGRFAGATGSFTMERFINQNTLTSVGSFRGTISAPGP